MKILISGASGLVGGALSQHLTNLGHQVLRLTRSAKTPQDVTWDYQRGVISLEALDALDLVIHLAGEPIIGLWTAAKREQIFQSRVSGTKFLVESLAKLKHPPKSFICASAIGYYGNRGDEQLDEDSMLGRGFLAETASQWEKSANLANEKFAARVVLLRFGIILDRKGGALAKMLLPFKLGLGGRLGIGDQYMSCISLAEVIRAIDFLINSQLKGAFNIVAPEPVTNLEFTKALGAALSRPTIFPVPEFIVRSIFGELADQVLLSSTRVVPKRLLEAGFKFEEQNVEQALGAILKINAK